ncbi:MAG: endonuclease/exonuclease/phosphatase family protein, partial [Gammaproteobacteria bacterium]|nr:endonuclease/exonuclease/phosphatase family protein [Gammaproteobacteria bacterium]
MKIISWNVNGLRAVERKGELSRFIGTEKPDVLLIQETKGQPDQLAPFQSTYPDYLQYYNSAEKKGYS